MVDSKTFSPCWFEELSRIRVLLPKANSLVFVPLREHLMCFLQAFMHQLVSKPSLFLVWWLTYEMIAILVTEN